MNVDFKGFNEQILTFEADSSVTGKNQWVTISANGKVAQASANSKLIGITVNVRNGYCGVQVGGIVTCGKTGSIDLGYTKLVYTANGIKKDTTNGKEQLVLAVDENTVTFIL